MHNTQSLSLILPVYNEVQNIEAVVKCIVTELANYLDNYEIIVINDGSTDQTAAIVDRLSLDYPFLHLIHHPCNKGYGATIRTGIVQAQKEWLLIMDADGQFDIKGLKLFWQKKEDSNFILGYRKKRNDNFYRRILGQTGNFLANLFIKTEAFINDIDCGFKLFKTSDLKKLSLTVNGGAISFEILYKILKNQTKFIQLPLKHYTRTTGRSTGGRFKTIRQIVLESIHVVRSPHFFRQGGHV